MQETLDQREVRDLIGVPVPHHQVGPAGKDRLDQPRNLMAAILVVAVGIDDDVGASPQTGVDAGLEGHRQAPGLPKTDDVLDPRFPRQLHGAIRAPVIDDQDLDLIHPGNLARNVRQSLDQAVLLVEARDLYDQFHETAF